MLWSTNTKPKMIVEKKPQIVPIHADGKYKRKWLMWWNSSPMSQKSLRFPPPNFKDSDLDVWLVKAFVLDVGNIIDYTSFDMYV